MPAALMLIVRPLMDTLAQIEAQLLQVFPAFVVRGTITPHTCEECVAIRSYLSTRSWTEVSDEFTEKYSGSLPLLSPEAYHMYLPAWLRAAARSPDGETARMLLYNLPDEPAVALFTKDQAAAVLSVARHVASSNLWGENDPGNVEQLAKIEEAWSARAA